MNYRQRYCQKVILCYIVEREKSRKSTWNIMRKEMVAVPSLSIYLSLYHNGYGKGIFRIRNIYLAVIFLYNISNIPKSDSMGFFI